MKFTPTLLIALLLAPLAALHAADARYFPDWSSIAPKRVIQHTSSEEDAGKTLMAFFGRNRRFAILLCA